MNPDYYKEPKLKKLQTCASVCHAIQHYVKVVPLQADWYKLLSTSPDQSELTTQ